MFRHNIRMHCQCSSRCCAGSRCQIHQQPILGDAHRIVHSALRRPVFPPLRRLPVFRGEFRGGTLVVDEFSRFGQPILERMEILAAPRTRKGARRLDGIVQGRVAHRRGCPDGRRNPMPARAGRRSGAGRAIGLPLGAEGSGQERTRPIPFGDRGAGRQRFHRRTLRCRVGKLLKLARVARNQETGGKKSYGGFGTYVGLGPKSAI